MNIEDRVGKSNIEDIVNAIVAMRIQEDTAYRCSEYLNPKAELEGKVDGSCRTKMAQWCFQVSDFCQFSFETVGIGMSYFDRFLCTSVGKHLLHDRKRFQLAAMCTLYTAIKLFEPRQMGIDLMSELSRGCYSETEIADMEKIILDGLKWRMNPPTPERFVRESIRLLHSLTIEADTITAILDICQLQISLSVKESDFVGSKPSTIAIASILNSVEMIDQSYLCPSLKTTFISDLEQIHITPIHSPEIKQMQRMLRVCISESPPTKAAIQQNMYVNDPRLSNKRNLDFRAKSPASVKII